jgi:hypothetical protein
MKKLILSTIVSLLSTMAFADGFNCSTKSDDLNISVYNMVNPTDGTRSPSVMVVSDPAVSTGRKTIAKFLANDGLLSTPHLADDRLTYVGKVDLRYNNSGRTGELILGTHLGEVDTVRLDVSFVYGDNLVDNQVVDALVILTKRDGERIIRQANCARYLKD